MCSWHAGQLDTPQFRHGSSFKLCRLHMPAFTVSSFHSTFQPCVFAQASALFQAPWSKP